MSSHKSIIELSELASQDPEEILQYTLETWGAAQMDAYAARLQSGFMLLQEIQNWARRVTTGFRAAVATGLNNILCFMRWLKAHSVSPGFSINAWTRPVIFE